MRLFRGICAAAVATLVATLAVAPANAARLRPPHVVWMPGTKNYTRAHRPVTSIRWIVVHVTEGGFAGTLSWLRNPASHASANFVVSRRGTIVELVPKRDIAWHAGNWAVNEQSVGIEHVGITNNPSGFTKPEYRASARLTAYIARTSLMPIDREHIIGHNQVPDPTDPLLGGGIDNHTDPGRYWNWRRYIRLVRAYAYPTVHRKPVLLHVDSTTLTGGQTVAGTVPWRVHVSGPVTRVDFLVDGKLRWQDHRAPFAYAGGRGLQTDLLANGRHRLELRVYGHSGHWTRERFAIGVRNIHLAVALSGVAPREKIQGTVRLQALPNGATPVRVALAVDGRVVARDTTAPFVFAWNTTHSADGAHVVQLIAVAKTGLVARSRVPVIVQNQAPIVAWRLPAQGELLTGPVELQVLVRGPVVRVDYLLDGAPIGSAGAAPWTLTWDATTAAPGLRTLTAQAYGPNGRSDTAALLVVIAPPAPG